MVDEDTEKPRSSLWLSRLVDAELKWHMQLETQTKLLSRWTFMIFMLRRAKGKVEVDEHQNSPKTTTKDFIFLRLSCSRRYQQT
jgi:hypothetical protein